MPSEAIRFTTARGHELAARLELPEGEARAYALFAHCFTCSKDSKAAVYISQALAARGLGVLRFDFTGLGMSGGDFADSNFSSNVSDVVAAANYLRQRREAPRLLIGHSLGGAAVLASAAEIAEARAVATIGAPFEPRHVERLLVHGTEGILAAGEAKVDIGGRPFTIRRQFLEDLERQEPAKRIGELGKALLLMHSPRDTVVDIENATRIFIAAKHPKSFVSLDTADHLLTDRRDARYAAAVLGACTSMTVRMYADLKKLPLERVTVRLRHDKIHAADCADCETKEGKVDRIERVVELEGPLDDAQRAKLLEIANKCPVHRTLHSEVHIPTRLAD